MNRERYDVVVIGGGLAGASTAAVMARAGANVLVLEKERAFRDRVRGEYLAPWAVADLEALGILGTVLEAGAIALPALAGRSLKPRPVRTPEGDVPLSYSHTAVQEALLRLARAEGATVVRGARVTALETEARRVRYATDTGEQAASARLIVGADGRSSLARRALARVEHHVRSPYVITGVRLGGVAADPAYGYFIVREEVGELASLFPQDGGYARAYLLHGEGDGRAFAGAEGLSRFNHALVALGVPAEAVRGSYAAGPLATFPAGVSWVDHAAGGGLAVVGDAAGISDPTWGQGMALAFHDARVLSESLLGLEEWDAAANVYALEHDRYYRAIITIEGWLTELQLTPGDEAANRRQRVMEAWRAEPERARAVDLNGLGPRLNASEEIRRFVFAEDGVGALERDSGRANELVAAVA